MNLDGLSFGAPSAERDTGLDDYFVESAVFDRVSKKQKSIILGHRGAGKSALFKELARRRSNAGEIVIQIVPNDLSYEMLTDTMLSEERGAWAKTGAYTVAWRYTLLIMVMRQLTNKHLRLKASKEEKRLFTHMRDNYAGVDRRPLDTLLGYLRRMESFKVGKYEAGLKMRELQKLYQLEEIEPFMPTVQALIARNPVSIFVDELDYGWDASEDAQAFVAGLFGALLQLNRIEGLTMHLSLRQELYNAIPAVYEDAQKYRDVIESINWGPEQLRRLLLQRIRHFLPRLEYKSDEQTWNAVFADPRDFRYILDRSLYRPREVITYATVALENARRRPMATRISHEDVLNAEHAYSSDRCRDVASEYKFQYPGLLSLLEKFRGRPARWSRHTLEDFLLRIAAGELASDHAAYAWVNDRYPDQLMRILWQVGFLRAVVPEGSRASMQGVVRGSYEDASVDLDEVDAFSVHHMFRAYLGVSTG